MGEVVGGITDVRRVIIAFKAQGKCAGCWKPVGEFRDELSKKEYQISALCQTCQDLIFGTDEQWAALGEKPPEDAA